MGEYIGIYLHLTAHLRYRLHYQLEYEPSIVFGYYTVSLLNYNATMIGFGDLHQDSEHAPAASPAYYTG
jgi:hypothetical protein